MVRSVGWMVGSVEVPWVVMVLVVQLPVVGVKGSGGSWHPPPPPPSPPPPPPPLPSPPPPAASPLLLLPPLPSPLPAEPREGRVAGVRVGVGAGGLRHILPSLRGVEMREVQRGFGYGTRRGEKVEGGLEKAVAATVT
ncbi:hypothetical protein HZH66_013128 [Vespula vulgaris]|uniref:Uncharacterized protein n=1 Tax=Vespula vulgaris TaxID=7454 RepID=A0A834JBX7_VESVU|nr:hypothetical protein HZH66_013128 [Vespula vulgaris]